MWFLCLTSYMTWSALSNFTCHPSKIASKHILHGAGRRPASRTLTGLENNLHLGLLKSIKDVILYQNQNSKSCSFLLHKHLNRRQFYKVQNWLKPWQMNRAAPHMAAAAWASDHWTESRLTVKGPSSHTLANYCLFTEWLFRDKVAEADFRAESRSEASRAKTWYTEMGF